MGGPEEEDTEFKDFFEEEKNIQENTGTHNTDIVEQVENTPTDLLQVTILQLLLHHTLSAVVDLTLVGENVEKKSDDDLIELGLESENNKPITSQKSAQDKILNEASDSVIRYNLFKPLLKTNVLNPKTSTKPQFSTNQISKSHQRMVKVLTLLTNSFCTSDINQPSS